MMHALRLLHDDVCDFFVLLGDAGLGVNHQNRDVAALDGILGALDAEIFNRVVHAPRLPDAGGINQDVFLPDAVGLDLERHVNGVARRAGNRRDDDALGLRERIDDGRFADVRATDDGEFQRPIHSSAFRVQRFSSSDSDCGLRTVGGSKATAAFIKF